jgi:hypothetical protein
MQVAALRLADPRFKESYRPCKKIKELKSGQGPTKGCGARGTASVARQQIIDKRQLNKQQRNGVFCAVRAEIYNRLQECSVKKVSLLRGDRT